MICKMSSLARSSSNNLGEILVNNFITFIEFGDGLHSVPIFSRTLKKTAFHL